MSNADIRGLIFIILMLAGIWGFYIIVLKNRRKDKKPSTLSQTSYHNFAKFLDKNNITFDDEHFEKKLFKIKMLIGEGKRDIKEIAQESDCTFEECILKIKYLQKKQILTQFHIDIKGNELIECTPDDLKLIKKYTPFIYNNNFTLDEITIKKRRSTTQNYNKLRDNIFKELKYLVDNDLVNGIRLNEVDKEIIYYTLEKQKKRDLVTITCPNCGALNDINRGDKKRCEYCKTILEDE
jgi:DNA-binding Lrp family transcriptional regulator